MRAIVAQATMAAATTSNGSAKSEAKPHKDPTIARPPSPHGRILLERRRTASKPKL